MFGAGGCGGGCGGGGYGGATLPAAGGYGGTAARPLPSMAGVAAPGFGEAGGFVGGSFDGGGPASATMGTGMGDASLGGGGPPPENTQTLMPVTVRMLLDALERRRTGPAHGPDIPLRINNREISMITFVACVERSNMEQMFKAFHVNDGCGRVVVKKYADVDPTSIADSDPQPGEYVRVYGTLRHFGEDFHVSAHNIVRIESPNELAYHFIEVAFVNLSLMGKISPQQDSFAAKPMAMNGQAMTMNGQAY